jgi:hypothetical protein
MNFNQGKMQLNNKLKNATDYISSKMPSANQNHPNPVETLNPEDLTYLQSYIEQIKIKKLNQKMKSNNPDYGEPRNGFGVGNGINREVASHSGFLNNIRPNRAADVYDPISREVPVDWRTYTTSNPSPSVSHQLEPGSRGSSNTRVGKRSQQNMDMMNNYSLNERVNHNGTITPGNYIVPERVGSTIPKHYYNPYEYGAKQNSLPPTYKQPYIGPYDNDSDILINMGVPENMYQEKFPGQIRNVNVESSLLQKEMTHIPGQREITEKEINRFELLPFDPQDTRHIVWTDNMPRNGYPTRTERLEY